MSPDGGWSDVRTVDRLLAVVLGLAGLAGGLLVTAEVVAGLLDRPPLLLPVRSATAELTARSWSDTLVLVVAGAALAVGVLLLVAELTPRRRTELVLQPRDARVTCTVSTGSVGHLLEHAASGVPGVRAASARVRRRRARLDVSVPIRDRGEAGRMNERAAAAATGALTGLRLRSAPRLQVRRTEQGA